MVAILTKGKVVNRLLDLFPPNKRTPADFNQHFQVGLLLGCTGFDQVAGLGM